MGQVPHPATRPREGALSVACPSRMHDPSLVVRNIRWLGVILENERTAFVEVISDVEDREKTGKSASLGETEP